MNKSTFDNKISSPGLAFQPLYKQVEEHVTQLIVEQRWKPGEMLPNEFQLAEEFGVSQGTVRKALNALTDKNVLNRRQGVGTFVSEHTGHHGLYRFFPVVEDGQPPQLPKAELQSLVITEPTQEVIDALSLQKGEKVVELRRLRILGQVYCIVEDIYLPQKYFSSIVKEKSIPHTLYHFYQTQFGLTVHRTRDSIKAVIANSEDATLLGVASGEPMLEVRRLAHSLDEKPMEYRISRCRSDHYHYLVELS